MICNQCLIPDSYPGISFVGGVCQFCLHGDKIPKINSGLLGEIRFKEFFKQKKIDSAYDCIVPLSGGKDSSYILYYLAKKLNLKPLAVFFDNNFTTVHAKKNIEVLCQSLSVDLVVGGANLYRTKQIKEALLLSKALGKFVKVCGNCENDIRSLVLNEAIKRGIPYIIYGSTKYENSPESYLKDEVVLASTEFGTAKSIWQKLVRFYRLISRKNIRNLPAISFHAGRFMYFCFRDNLLSGIPEGWKKINPLVEVSFENKKAQVLYFYDFFEYDPYRQIKVLEQEAGWTAPAERESRMDCRLHSFGNYQSLLDNGITADGFTLAVLVRNGLISKEEAIIKEANLKKNLKNECQEIADQLGVEIF
jgi:hypothetical protein